MRCDGGAAVEYSLAVGCQCDGSRTKLNTVQEGHRDGKYKDGKSFKKQVYSQTSLVVECGVLLLFCRRRGVVAIAVGVAYRRCGLWWRLCEGRRSKVGMKGGKTLQYASRTVAA